MAVKEVRQKRRVGRVVSCAVAHIKSSANNTIVTVADGRGDTIAWASAGSVGFSGTRKSAAYAAQMAAEAVGQKARDLGVLSLTVSLKGTGIGREAALRALRERFEISLIRDKTPLAHAGCRPPKHRRM